MDVCCCLQIVASWFTDIVKIVFLLVRPTLSQEATSPCQEIRLSRSWKTSITLDSSFLKRWTTCTLWAMCSASSDTTFNQIATLSRDEQPGSLVDQVFKLSLSEFHTSLISSYSLTLQVSPSDIIILSYFVTKCGSWPLLKELAIHLYTALFFMYEHFF